MPARGTFKPLTYRKHGHFITFTSGPGYAYIDVSFDGAGAGPVDVINMYDYEAGVSTLHDRDGFKAAAREYLRELDPHDADEYARA